ncbi:MAG: hypothetical protein F6K40_03485 [Okeania sp. SIO3I5]|nr:hypothetical protein [Okeania sp. SIO3I5]
MVGVGFFSPSAKGFGEQIPTVFSHKSFLMAINEIETVPIYLPLKIQLNMVKTIEDY